MTAQVWALRRCWSLWAGSQVRSCLVPIHWLGLGVTRTWTPGQAAYCATPGGTIHMECSVRGVPWRWTTHGSRLRAPPALKRRLSASPEFAGILPSCGHIGNYLGLVGLVSILLLSYTPNRPGLWRGQPGRPTLPLSCSDPPRTSIHRSTGSSIQKFYHSSFQKGA